MGCPGSKPDVKVSNQISPPKHTPFVPGLLLETKDVYVLMERFKLMSLFTGANEFQVENMKHETSLKIRQSQMSLSDRMEVLQKDGEEVSAVLRRARMSLYQTFYIYTLEKPYAEAKPSNESHDGKNLYCWGFLWKIGYVRTQFQVCRYYYDPAVPAGSEDPYTMVYIFKNASSFNGNLVGYAAGEDGQVALDESGNEVVISVCSRDLSQWDQANVYFVEVAAGVDGGLVIAAMTMIDEIDWHEHPAGGPYSQTKK